MLGTASGVAVGFSLGLVGGGGSILAVPLMVYLVGIDSPHVAIGTSAVAVAANAGANLRRHSRAGTVKWPCALTFSASGVAGAFAGAALGKMLDGQRLLALFALLMLVVAALMFKLQAALGRGAAGRPAQPRQTYLRCWPLASPPGCSRGFSGSAAAS